MYYSICKSMKHKNYAGAHPEAEDRAAGHQGIPL